MCSMNEVNAEGGLGVGADMNESAAVLGENNTVSRTTGNMGGNTVTITGDAAVIFYQLNRIESRLEHFITRWEERMGRLEINYSQLEMQGMARQGRIEAIEGKLSKVQAKLDQINTARHWGLLIATWALLLVHVTVQIGIWLWG